MPGVARAAPEGLALACLAAPPPPVKAAAQRDWRRRAPTWAAAVPEEDFACRWRANSTN